MWRKLFLLVGLLGIFPFYAHTQKRWPIDGSKGGMVVQAGPSHSEAWLGISPNGDFRPWEIEALPFPFTPTHFLKLSWVDVRNLVRVYEDSHKGFDSLPYVCLESLENWEFKTECFDAKTGKWIMASSRDARADLLLRLGGYSTEEEAQRFLVSLPCPPQDSTCRRLAMPFLLSILKKIEAVDSMMADKNAPELLFLDHQLQIFLENGAGKTLLDFRRTSQAQAFFTEQREINALWLAYNRLANHYLKTQHWGSALLLLNTLKRVRPEDLEIQSLILQAETEQ